MKELAIIGNWVIELGVDIVTGNLDNMFEKHGKSFTGKIIKDIIPGNNHRLLFLFNTEDREGKGYSLDHYNYNYNVLIPLTEKDIFGYNTIRMLNPSGAHYCSILEEFNVHQEGFFNLNIEGVKGKKPINFSKLNHSIFKDIRFVVGQDKYDLSRNVPRGLLITSGNSQQWVNPRHTKLEYFTAYGRLVYNKEKKLLEGEIIDEKHFLCKKETHPDCCGVDLLYNFEGNVLSRDSKYNKYTKEQLVKITHKIAGIPGLGGPALMAHLIDRQSGSQRFVESLGFVPMFQYINNNSSNEITVYHYNIPKNDEIVEDF